MAKAKSEHYVNNKELLEALIVYRSKVEISYIKKFGREPTKQERGTKWEGKPQITNYLGSCFLKIATHLSYKPNFVNYMFREDMISDGIENCIQYIHNFNPDKSKNPFAYFTQIIHYAFLRRIQREKRQLDIKNKIVEKTGFESLMTSDSNLTSEYRNDYNAIKENIITKLNS
ncbi:hypothetical protein [Winogradskyella sp.]|uniref:hypothetical protein n=1 Tax=Winogradskyella sp. TaxID=1883156 RepID=UPI003F69B41D